MRLITQMGWSGFPPGYKHTSGATSPDEPGLYTLWEAIGDNGEHLGWRWENMAGVSERGAGVAVPDDCKRIYVCMNRDIYEKSLKDGMKPLMQDDFMPVFISYA